MTYNHLIILQIRDIIGGEKGVIVIAGENRNVVGHQPFHSFGLHRGLLGTLQVGFPKKDEIVTDYCSIMLARTLKMFQWSGLPDTIPVEFLERYIQTVGYAAVTEVDGNLYAFTGGLGGPPDVYYQPTICTVANPALNFSKSLRIGEECAIVRNDPLFMGLMPIFTKYANILTENEISIVRAVINGRMLALISASDDKSYMSAKKYLADVEEGKSGAVMDPKFLDGIKAQPLATTNSGNILTALLETEQYFLGRWYHDIGIQAPYNMKREALNSAETVLNEDALFPLVDRMLESRQKGADEINRLYGTNIGVSLSSIWEENTEQAELSNRLDETEVTENADTPDI